MKRSLLAALIATAAMACGGSGGSSGSAATSPTPSAQKVAFTETDFKIDPATDTLKAGAYTFQVQNAGKLPHDLHIAPEGGDDMAHTTLLQANQSGSFDVTLKKGVYTMWCAVDSHRQRGM